MFCTVPFVSTLSNRSAVTARWGKQLSTSVFILPSPPQASLEITLQGALIPVGYHAVAHLWLENKVKMGDGEKTSTTPPQAPLAFISSELPLPCFPYVSPMLRCGSLQQNFYSTVFAYGNGAIREISSVNSMCFEFWSWRRFSSSRINISITGPDSQDWEGEKHFNVSKAEWTSKNIYNIGAVCLIELELPRWESFVSLKCSFGWKQVFAEILGLYFMF